MTKQVQSPERSELAPSALQRFLELLGVFALSITEPVLSVFGESPETFVLLRAGRFEIVLFALVVTLVPATIALGAEQLVGLIGRTAQHALHVTLLGAGIGSLALMLVNQLTDLGRPTSIGIAGAVVALVAIAYLELPPVRLWTRYLAPAAPLFLGIFLVASPTAELVLPGAGAVEASNPVAATTPVVVLVLDEFPTSAMLDANGQIDADLYPQLAGLAADATWFRNATTVYPFTTHAVPALLTGRLPAGDDVVPNARTYPESLFTLLGASYETNAAEVWRMCPDAECRDQRGSGKTSAETLRTLLSASLDTLEAQLRPTRERLQLLTIDDQVDRGEDVRRLQEWLDEIDGDGPPNLSVAHLLVPHHPWVTTPSGATHDVPLGGRIHEVDVWESEPAAALAQQLLVAQAMWVDSLVGEMTETLKDEGIYDDAVIVVTADHGIAFEVGESIRTPGSENITEIAWVPLIVKEPGQRDGRVDDRNALTVDVVPTIADLLGIDIPWAVDGTSLTGEPRTDSTKPFLAFLDEEKGEFPDGLDGRGGLRRLLAAAREDFVATGDPLLRPYATGRARDLVGASLASLTIEEPHPAALRLTTSDGRLVADGEPVGPWVTGIVDDGFDDDSEFAFALDGQIVATAAAYDIGDGREIASLLPEHLLSDAELEVFVVDDRRALRPVGLD